MTAGRLALMPRPAKKQYFLGQKTGPKNDPKKWPHFSSVLNKIDYNPKVGVTKRVRKTTPKSDPNDCQIALTCERRPSQRASRRFGPWLRVRLARSHHASHHFKEVQRSTRRATPRMTRVLQTRMQATPHQSALASDVWLGLSTCGCCHFCEAVTMLERLSLERATLAPEPRSSKRCINYWLSR